MSRHDRHTYHRLTKVDGLSPRLACVTIHCVCGSTFDGASFLDASELFTRHKAFSNMSARRVR